MKIAIVGLGLAGSYLFKRLTLGTDHQITAFERHCPDKQQRLVCGWGVHSTDFDHYARQCLLDPSDYYLHQAQKAYLTVGDASIVVPVYDLCTFNKQTFLTDLQAHIPGFFAKVYYGKGAYYDHGIERSSFDLIIDATGYRRSMLGPISNGIDQFIHCRQYVIQYENSPPYDDFHMELYRDGYLWLFPLTNGLCHIGAGTFDHSHKEKLLQFFEKYGDYTILEVGNKPVRILPTSQCLPFSKENIIGVGEAIGVVRPLVGEGIIPSLRSAEILFDCLCSDSLQDYENLILQEFKSHDREWSYVQARLRQDKWACLWHGLHLKNPHGKLSFRQKIKIYQGM